MKTFKLSNRIPRARFFADATPPKDEPKPWFSIKNEASSDAAEICIYDQIGRDYWSGEGTEAKQFIDELKTIPKGRAITLRINSPGGEVHAGMAIYNRLRERKDDLTVIVDGVAASIASVIALAGKTLEMPANTLFMIHDPWGMVAGNAEELRKAADMLDTHRDAILSVYERKTGLSAKQLEKLMADETWYTGKEAMEAKFADKVTDEISFQACTTSTVFNKFGRVPDQLRNKKQENTDMNRKKLMARLKKLGIEFQDSMTDAELQALIDAHYEAAENKAAKSSASSEASEEEGEAENEADPAPTNRARNRNQNNSEGSDIALKAVQAALEVVQKQNKAIEARSEKERKQRIEREIDACIVDDKIPANSRDKWVKRAMADETVLDDIREMESRPPGSRPVTAIIVGEAPRDVEKGILAMRQPLQSFLKGNDVDASLISRNAKNIAVAIALHRKKLDHILNTNTVDPELKRNVILSDLMVDFKRVLLMLNVFSTTYTNVPLEGTNKVTVPFYDLDTVAATDYVEATGYTFGEDTDVSSRDITVNRRKFKSMNFSSSTFRRQPYFNPTQSMRQKSAQLGVDVWLDILSLIKADPYGVSVMDVEAGAFDVDNLTILRKVANDNDWPEIGRACVLGTDHDAALLQDDSLKHFQNSGSTEPLRAGSTGRLLNFDMFYSPRIPTNGEDLGGFICLPQALLIATAPIAPAPGVRAKLLSYDLVVDPDTGIAFEYRYGADEWADKDREVVECNYGFAKGNARALKRITNGAANFSSSSSASSVNSSSSSSSSPSF